MGMFDWLFGNPGDEANKYLGQIPEQIGKYYDPYIQAGHRAIPNLESQYGNLLNDPGGMVNKFGQGFQQSPGFDFALKRALEGGNRSAAAGGMAGSPMHQEQNMATATGMANQDYYNWLDRTLGMYGAGLQGEQGLAQGGLQAGGSMADQIAQMLAQQAGYSYAGGMGQKSGMGGLLGGGLGAGLGYAFGGPMGGYMGGKLGSGMFGGGGGGGGGNSSNAPGRYF